MPSAGFGADAEQAAPDFSPVQIPIGLEHEHSGLVDLLHMKAYDFHGKFEEDITEVWNSQDPQTPSVPLPASNLYMMRCGPQGLIIWRPRHV